MQSSDWTGTQAYANYRKNTILSGQENNCDKYHFQATDSLYPHFQDRTYEDNLKSDYYGSNVSNRLNTWYFDVFHDKELFPVVKQSIMDSEGNVEYSATNAESVSADYRPNAVFESLSSVNNAESIELTNFDVSCSVGNYSVRETYDITLSNTGSDKIIEFRNLNWQNFIVETYDSVNGENKIYYTGNGKTDAQELSDNDRLLHYVRVNKGETVRMIITITLVTGDPGGEKNYIKCYNAN